MSPAKSRSRNRIGMVNRTVAFRTLGCKQNQFDTEALRQRLRQAGCLPVEDLRQAGWIILNTCAVTGKALAKARGEIGRLRRLNPGARIVALGCGTRYQPQHFTGADYLGSLPPELISTVEARPGFGLEAPHGVIPAGKSRGYLRIQTGCDQACAYCVVPSLRGPSRSLPPTDCRAALRELQDRGAGEVILTGTNIALWGKDREGRPTLQYLLEYLLSEPGSARLRLSSLEPHLVTPEFLRWCLQQPRICPHFHFAFQTGSPAVLKRMRRGAPHPDLGPFLRELRAGRPDVCLGSDVIAGFPGESAEEFTQTLEWIRSIPLSYLHVFPYSARPGTAAADLPDRVPQAPRLERAARLRALNAELKDAFTRRNLGTEQEIITLEPAEGAASARGLTANYLRLEFDRAFTPRAGRFRAPLTESLAARVYMHE
ncbi:MAG: radical SAM protein [Candidatus Zixiibacteriota bacterium]|nr:MAG: radical SAM protein [candidate division Zixibacteria bacterium]